MKTQKGIIHLGLILVVLVFGIGALVFVMYKTNSLPVVTTSSPTPSSISEPMLKENKTSDWKIYTNARYGYTFKYPSEFILQGQDADAKGVVTEETRNIAVFDPRYRDYKDRILDIQHFDLMTPPTPNWNGMIVNIGSLEVTKFTNNSPETQFDIYQIAQANGGLEIMAQKAIQTEIVNQILSTFEFVQDTSNWKTLSYKKFSMKYPSQWQTVDPNNASLFPLKERFSFSANNFKALVLNKKDIYLIISIEDEYDGGAGGVFLNDDYYQEFISNKDELKIGESTFFINKSSNKISELKVSHGGPYTWSSLSEYLPKGKYENVIKRNGYMYNFVLASIEGGLTDEQTQQELISMLKTISW